MRSSGPLLGTALRLALGALLVVAGALKVADLRASGMAVAAYQVIGYETSLLVGAVLPFVEIMAGLLLITGLATRVAAGLAATLLIVFIGAIISVWLRGLQIDCGCFGGDGNGRSNYLLDVLRDAALLTAAGYLIWRPLSRWSLDARILGR